MAPQAAPGPVAAAGVSGASEAADVSPSLFGRLRPVRTVIATLLVKRLKERALAAGATPAQFDTIVDRLEDERPILDWLKNGGFEALLKFIMELIALFAAAGEPSVESVLGRRPVRGFLAQVVVNALRLRVSSEHFEQALAGAESERPILDWLKDGGFEALLKFIMELIAVIGG